MPNWLTIVLALGGSTLIALTVNALWALVKNLLLGKKAKRDKEKEELEKLQKEQLERERHELYLRREDEWRQTVINLIQPIEQKIDDIREELIENKKATIISLRSNMKSLRDKYKGQGFADAGDKATWAELYSEYRDMGGNHFKEYVDAWKNEVETLPLQKKNSTSTPKRKVTSVSIPKTKTRKEE